jgi:hypothetical protein
LRFAFFSAASLMCWDASAGIDDARKEPGDSRPPRGDAPESPLNATWLLSASASPPPPME